MKKFLSLLGIALLLGACGEKDLKFYPNFEESVTIPVESDIQDSEYKGSIPASDIRAAIDEVLDQTDGQIEKVNIEALWFVVAPKEGNQVQGGHFDAYIKSASTGEYIQILDDYKVEVDANKKQAPLDELMSGGVEELKTQLEAIAKGSPLGDVEFKFEEVVGDGGDRKSVV